MKYSKKQKIIGVGITTACILTILLSIVGLCVKSMEVKQDVMYAVLGCLAIMMGLLIWNMANVDQ